jgi:FtsP/CotA-like multicopper oxidase with cupredoxin domain
MIPGTPSTYTLSQGLATSDVSLVPEGFVDTAVVNGVAYPYLDVKPQAYRFRILNGANDRYWNLQMYCSAADKPSAAGLYNAASKNLPADATLPMWASPTARVPQNAAAGEVPMVPAVRTAGFPADWPTDGRSGGVPDPAARAGDFLQFGTESGVLPNAVDVTNQPVNYVYNRRDIIVLSISTHALLLGPAERADVVFDFAAAKAKGCTNVILYNDAPTPVPAFDPRNDYYSNNGDMTDSGGTPSTLPGYGPNTRTIMQFRINQAADAGYNWTDAKLRAEVPKWFAATQHKPITPEIRYAEAYTDPITGVVDPIGTSNVYSRIQSNNLAFSTSSVGDIGSLNLGTAGSGYAPTATAAVAAPGTAAALVPVFNGAGRVTSVTVVKGGTGYPPNQNTNGNNGVPVVISQPIGGTAAVAHAATSALGVITSVKVNSGGNRYTAGATVTIAAPTAGGFTATATATVNLNNGAISALTLTDVGNGYAVPPAAAPAVTISPALYVGGVHSLATATVANSASNVNVAMEPKAIQELFEMDYGRMNATLGVELPFTNSTNQTTLPLGYAEPTSEFMKPTQLGTQIGTTRNGTEIWKITHNGVDTHTIHFHLSDVQLVNRVGWDGAIRPPDDNELGWKESVRMNPLEDAIVAMRPETPPLPFKIGDSVRVIDPTMPANHQMTSLDPLTGNAVTYTNSPVSFGWEYVWHCHLLGHEENDMMRPVDFKGSPDAPTLVSVAKTTGNPRPITVTWRNNANWQLTNFVVQRTSATGNNPQPNWANAVQTLSDKPSADAAPTTLGGLIAKGQTSIVDPGAGKAAGTTYYYRVRAESAQGVSAWSTVRSVRY